VTLPVQDPLEFGTPLEDLGGLLDVRASDVLFPAVSENRIRVAGGDSLLGAFLRGLDLLVPVGVADVLFHWRSLAGCTRASLAAARNSQDPAVFSLAIANLVQLQLLVLTGAHAGGREDDEGVAVLDGQFREAKELLHLLVHDRAALAVIGWRLITLDGFSQHLDSLLNAKLSCAGEVESDGRALRFEALRVAISSMHHRDEILLVGRARDLWRGCSFFAESEDSMDVRRVLTEESGSNTLRPGYPRCVILVLRIRRLDRGRKEDSDTRSSGFGRQIQHLNRRITDLRCH